MSPDASMASPTTWAGRSRRPTTGRMRQPLVCGGKASQMVEAVSSPRTDAADCLSEELPLKSALSATTRLDLPLP